MNPDASTLLERVLPEENKPEEQQLPCSQNRPAARRPPRGPKEPESPSGTETLCVGGNRRTQHDTRGTTERLQRARPPREVTYSDSFGEHSVRHDERQHPQHGGPLQGQRRITSSRPIFIAHGYERGKNTHAYVVYAFIPRFIGLYLTVGYGIEHIFNLISHLDVFLRRTEGVRRGQGVLLERRVEVGHEMCVFLEENQRARNYGECIYMEDVEVCLYVCICVYIYTYIYVYVCICIYNIFIYFSLFYIIFFIYLILI